MNAKLQQAHDAVIARFDLEVDKLGRRDYYDLCAQLVETLTKRVIELSKEDLEDLRKKMK